MPATPHLKCELSLLDRTGIITAKFEGPVSLAELDAALARVIS